jgi:hypothetical protein
VLNGSRNGAAAALQIVEDGGGVDLGAAERAANDLLVALGADLESDHLRDTGPWHSRARLTFAVTTTSTCSSLPIDAQGVTPGSRAETHPQPTAPVLGMNHVGATRVAPYHPRRAP